VSAPCRDEVAEGWEKLNKGLNSLQNNDDEIKKK
jgi:hypothetical protein